MKKKKIKISFIGVGFMSQIAHVKNFFNIEEVELTDIADIDIEMAKNVKNSFGFKGKVYKDYKKLLENKPDGVVIVVQRPLVTKIIKEALKKNINVLSEKPPVYSVKDYNDCLKIQKKNIWIKGFNRRWDGSLNDLKNNFLKYSKHLGNLVTTEYSIKAGNTYLDQKHHARPVLKSKFFGGDKNNYPKFLPTKFKQLYEMHWNSTCHYLDLYNFLSFKDLKNYRTSFGVNFFTTNFDAKLNNKNVNCSLNIVNSKVNEWYEKLIFNFMYGQISINFVSPLYTGSGHKVSINYSLKNKYLILKKLNDNSFKNQAQGFINLIKGKSSGKKNSKEGIFSIKTYEKLWDTFLKNK
tara:strand:+ start:2263 stop:3315 length:1053 start_codon:yes stop_codon:yes gene_type:complete